MAKNRIKTISDFKGKPQGKQKYVIPIAVKNKKYCMDMEVVDLIIQMSGD